MHFFAQRADMGNCDVANITPCKFGKITTKYMINRYISCFQIIAEGANGPTTMGADRIFLERKILVIPVSDLSDIKTLTIEDYSITGTCLNKAGLGDSGFKPKNLCS
jgi:hypothetical protein